ncbi:Peptidyl-prolyl cis-trans isomerase [Quillaja saponaria]|uniref:Peptidyl-prolyl cis-trans isomerase n=1 Tax=Quillaja saponaria TaxID=32244 RepID=A0AAD7Q1J3_QUISA|nr:Peptidyl-prolyl cis-trans isomerase [Quillaja saponaria]
MARIKPQTLLQQSKKKKGPAGTSAVTIVLYSLIVVVFGFFLVATYRHWSQRSQFPTEHDISVSKGENAFVDPKKSDLPGYAVLNTSKGPITVELYKESSPEVVDEFIDLSQKGHFKGMLFHCVIKHYVIQAGDNQWLGATEDWTLRGKHYNQLHTSFKHEAFMLGTSKGKHDHKGFELLLQLRPSQILMRSL